MTFNCATSGGNYSSDVGILKSTEVYYLDGQSEPAGDLSEARTHLLLVEVNKPAAKIYAVGGGESTFVEEWQHSTKTWSKKSLKLKLNRNQFGAVGVHSEMICPQE